MKPDDYYTINYNYSTIEENWNYAKLNFVLKIKRNLISPNLSVTIYLFSKHLKKDTSFFNFKLCYVSTCF